MNKAAPNLRQSKVFSALTEEDEQLLTKFVMHKRFPPNTALLKTGQICSNIYVLVDCEVICSGMDEPEKVLGPGESIGVEAVLKGQPMSADFRISQEGSALVIPATALEELFLLSPTLASSIVLGLKSAEKS